MVNLYMFILLGEDRHFKSYASRQRTHFEQRSRKVNIDQKKVTRIGVALRKFVTIGTFRKL